MLISASTSEIPLWSRNPAQTVGALEDAYNAGLRAVLLTDSLEDERAQSDLRWIAGRSPIHFVVGKIDQSAFEIIPVDQYGALPDGLTEIQHPNRRLLSLHPEPMSWTEAMERAPLALMDLGLDALTVRRILIDNPALAFTTRQSAPTDS